jgi:hypothetical protein
LLRESFLICIIVAEQKMSHRSLDQEMYRDELVLSHGPLCRPIPGPAEGACQPGRADNTILKGEAATLWKT